ncbi:Transposase [Neochlamydia sp. TUME1]|nr:Transposase [Neochlamydia sp. TUME1]
MDTQGFLLTCYVGAADENDRTALIKLLDKCKSLFSTITKVWADMGYQGTVLKQTCQDQYNIDFEIVKRPRRRFRVQEDKIEEFLKTIDLSFKVLPKRWIVERTFAWIGRNRRTSKDYEYLTTTSENWIYLSMIRLMLRRINKLKEGF